MQRARTDIGAKTGDGQPRHSIEVSDGGSKPVITMPASNPARKRPGMAFRSQNIRQIEHNGLIWVDITNAGSGEIEWLRSAYNFHPLYIEDTLSKVQLPKVDDEDDYAFLVMHFPVYSKLVRVTTASEVDMFVGANYLVTIHSGNLKPLTNLFTQCHDDPAVRARVMGRSSGYLLYSVVGRLVDYCFPIVNKIDANIEQTEDAIFDEDRVRRTILEISVIRRDLIAFRRIIRRLIPVISSLERKSRPFMGEDMEDYFGDIYDHLSKIGDTLEDMKEVIEGLSDTINSLTNSRSNEVIKVLTVISVILLPLTLISGIFGMNVDLPFDTNPYSFGFIIGFMLLVSIAMLAFFRKRRWI